MKQVTTHYAKTHLSGILRDVQHGQSVIILQGKTPVGKLTAVRQRRTRAPKAGRPTSEPVQYSPDAFAPLTPADLKAWGL